MQAKPVKMIRDPKRALRHQRQRRRQKLLGGLLGVTLCLFGLLIFAAVQYVGSSGGEQTDSVKSTDARRTRSAHSTDVLLQKQRHILEGLETLKKMGIAAFEVVDISDPAKTTPEQLRRLRPYANTLNTIGSQIKRLDATEPSSYVFCTYRHLLNSDEKGVYSEIDRGLRASPGNPKLLRYKEICQLMFQMDRELNSKARPGLNPASSQPSTIVKRRQSRMSGRYQIERDRLLMDGLRIIVEIDDSLLPLENQDVTVAESLRTLRNLRPQGQRLYNLGKKIQALDPSEADGYLFCAIRYLFDLDLDEVNSWLDKGLLACPGDSDLLEAKQEWNEIMDTLVEAS